MQVKVKEKTIPWSAHRNSLFHSAETEQLVLTKIFAEHTSLTTLELTKILFTPSIMTL